MPEPARQVHRFAAVASTMDEARRLAHAGAPDGAVVLAEEQTGGRGQHGRPWFAPKGGLYLSRVIRDLHDPHLLTLAVGNAVGDALEVAGAEPRLKWVNDVLLGGRKVAGVLVEGEATGPHFDFLVAGVGVNVNAPARPFPSDILAGATTLQDALHCESCIPDLEAYLMDAMDRWVGLVRDEQDGAIVSAFRARDACKGHRVRVEASGQPAVEGKALGIDDAGHLLVDVAGNVTAFAHGTVRIVG